MTGFLDPALYDDPDEQQQRWAGHYTAQLQRQQITVTPDMADRVSETIRRYPWLEAGAISSLVRAGASQEVIHQAAVASANARG